MLDIECYNFQNVCTVFLLIWFEHDPDVHDLIIFKGLMYNIVMLLHKILQLKKMFIFKIAIN